VLLILVAVFLLLAILFLRRTYGTLEKCGIPVIKPSLFLGSEPFMKHKTNYIELDRDNFRKYGRVWGSYDMCEPWVYVADTKLIKAITVKDFEYFSSHWGFGSPDSKFITLDAAKGQEWKDLRRGLTPTFSSGKIKGMLSLIGSSVDNMVDHLEVVTKDNSLVDVKHVFQSMALDVIAKCAFGIESNSFKNPNNEVFIYGKKLFEEFNISSLPASVAMNLFQVHEKISKLIDIIPASMGDLWKITKSVQLQRQSSGAGPGDFIDILNELNKRHEQGEFPALTSDMITGQGIIFIAAGFETTSNCLSTLCYNLARYPHVLKTLLEEVDDITEKFNGQVDHETITDMPFLEACIKENLRMFAPVSRNDRLCVKDWQGEGEFAHIKIQKGTYIGFPYHVIHHDPELWPEPEQFRPERFLKENASSIVPFSFLSFGSGPRKCIGERFAMAEIKIAMVKLLQKFRVEFDETTKIDLLNGDMFLFSFPRMNIRFIKR